MLFETLLITLFFLNTNYAAATSPGLSRQQEIYPFQAFVRHPPKDTLEGLEYNQFIRKVMPPRPPKINCAPWECCGEITKCSRDSDGSCCPSAQKSNVSPKPTKPEEVVQPNSNEPQLPKTSENIACCVYTGNITNIKEDIIQNQLRANNKFVFDDKPSDLCKVVDTSVSLCDATPGWTKVADEISIVDDYVLNIIKHIEVDHCAGLDKDACDERSQDKHLPCLWIPSHLNTVDKPMCVVKHAYEQSLSQSSKQKCCNFYPFQQGPFKCGNPQCIPQDADSEDKHDLIPEDADSEDTHDLIPEDADSEDTHDLIRRGLVRRDLIEYDQQDRDLIRNHLNQNMTPYRQYVSNPSELEMTCDTLHSVITSKLQDTINMLKSQQNIPMLHKLNYNIEIVDGKMSTTQIYTQLRKLVKSMIELVYSPGEVFKSKQNISKSSSMISDITKASCISEISPHCLDMQLAMRQQMKNTLISLKSMKGMHSIPISVHGDNFNAELKNFFKILNKANITMLDMQTFSKNVFFLTEELKQIDQIYREKCKAEFQSQVNLTNNDEDGNLEKELPCKHETANESPCSKVCDDQLNIPQPCVPPCACPQKVQNINISMNIIMGDSDGQKIKQTSNIKPTGCGGDVGISPTLLKKLPCILSKWMGMLSSDKDIFQPLLLDNTKSIHNSLRRNVDG